MHMFTIPATMAAYFACFWRICHHLSDEQEIMRGVFEEIVWRSRRFYWLSRRESCSGSDHPSVGGAGKRQSVGADASCAVPVSEQRNVVGGGHITPRRPRANAPDDHSGDARHDAHLDGA